MTNSKSNIIVSICCITYNHAPFIRKALDGFLMQEPPTGVLKDEPWYEILIHDDCSTDGTTEIIKEYAAKYPDRIFPLYETENQYKMVGTAGIDVYNYIRAKGRYIAYCEGDDYWTDPHKLQKQVDFMDAHPEYSICFHDFVIRDGRNGKLYESKDQFYYKQQHHTEQGIDITVADYFAYQYGQPLTMLFRVSMFDIDWRKRYIYYRDTHEIYHLLKAGKGYWMNFKGGEYTAHSGGISSLISSTEQHQITYEVQTELYTVSPDLYTKKFYAKSLQWLIDEHAQIEGVSRAAIIWKLFRLTKDVKHLIKNIFVRK